MNKKNKQLKKFILVIIIVIGVAVLLGELISYQRISSKPVDTLTVGMKATAVNTLIYIATELDFFKANHLNVIIKDDCQSGSAAIDDIIKGKIDIATVVEPSIVQLAFKKEKIETFGNIDQFMHQYLIAPQGAGVKQIADLKGKKIGVPFNTGARFNLSRFLMLNNIAERELTLVDIQAPQSLAALQTNEVDAVVTWQPYMMDINTNLSDRSSMNWSIQNGQPTYCSLITTEAFATKNPQLLDRFLRSLLLAEEYLIKNNDKARTLIQKRLNYSRDYIQTIWAEHEFSISLDQPFILAMEDQARWMISNQLTTEKQVPNIPSYIDETILGNLKPYSVSIIR